LDIGIEKEESKMKRITEATWIDSLDESPLGPITFSITKRGLVRVHFGTSSENTINGNLQEISTLPTQRDLLAKIKRQLAAYFSGRLKIFDIPVDWGVLSTFQQKALRALQKVPYGQITTYSRMASDIGQPNATRAVGGAMARNPMPVIIPCHRVVASDGQLTGYSGSGGLETKAWLLQLEGRLVTGQRVIDNGNTAVR
jgi:methylated-DNA-[protein]-cysteine S-methyltransferase